MLNPCQEPQASSNSPNQDLKDTVVLCTFKIKIESRNWDHGCIKYQWPYPNHDQDAKPQSGISSILQSSKSGLRGHWYSLHLQNQDREPKIETWVYQRPVAISWSGSRCHTMVRNPHSPPKLQIRSKRTWMFLHLQNKYREPTLRTSVYQRPLTLSKSRSWYQTPMKNHQHPSKPQCRT